jgi:hypothetical protein
MYHKWSNVEYADENLLMLVKDDATVRGTKAILYIHTLGFVVLLLAMILYGTIRGTLYQVPLYTLYSTVTVKSTLRRSRTVDRVLEGPGNDGTYVWRRTNKRKPICWFFGKRAPREGTTLYGTLLYLYALHGTLLMYFDIKLTAVTNCS